MVLSFSYLLIFLFSYLQARRAHGQSALPAVVSTDDVGSSVFHFSRFSLRACTRLGSSWAAAALVVIGPGQVPEDAAAGRDLACHDGRAAGGTDRAGHVEMGEEGAFLSEMVECRCLDAPVAVTTQVAPAEVIGKEEPSVSLRLRFQGQIMVLRQGLFWMRWLLGRPHITSRSERRVQVTISALPGALWRLVSGWGNNVKAICSIRSRGKHIAIREKFRELLGTPSWS